MSFIQNRVESVSYPVNDLGALAVIDGVGEDGELGSGHASLLRGRGMGFLSISSEFSVILSVLLNRAPSPNDLLLRLLGLLKGSLPGEDMYPESFGDKDLSLGKLGARGSVRLGVSRCVRFN